MTELLLLVLIILAWRAGRARVIVLHERPTGAERCPWCGGNVHARDHEPSLN
jgi:hypothetical protein